MSNHEDHQITTAQISQIPSAEDMHGFPSFLESVGPYAILSGLAVYLVQFLTKQLINEIKDLNKETKELAKGVLTLTNEVKEFSESVVKRTEQSTQEHMLLIKSLEALTRKCRLDNSDQ